MSDQIMMIIRAIEGKVIGNSTVSSDFATHNSIITYSSVCLTGLDIECLVCNLLLVNNIFLYIYGTCYGQPSMNLLNMDLTLKNIIQQK